MPYREAPSGVFRLVQTLPPQPPRTHTHTHRQEAATYHITPVHWTDSLTCRWVRRVHRSCDC